MPQDKREAYREMAQSAVPIFEKYGAGRMVETFAADVPHGLRSPEVAWHTSEGATRSHARVRA